MEIRRIYLRPSLIYRQRYFIFSLQIYFSSQINDDLRNSCFMAEVIEMLWNMLFFPI
jgi:hypothetical protein